MGFKDKLFGGPQNPSQPVIDDNIVNPQYYMMPDGSVASDADPEKVNGGNPIQSSFPQKNNKPVAYPQNGYQQYGYQQNAYPQDAYQQNGYQQNAYPQDAYQQNGYQQNAYPQDAYQQNAYPQDAYQQNGYQQNGYQQNAYPQDAYQQNYPPMNNDDQFNMQNEDQPNGYPVSSAQGGYLTDTAQQYQQEYTQDPYQTSNGAPDSGTGWNSESGE